MEFIRRSCLENLSHVFPFYRLWSCLRAIITLKVERQELTSLNALIYYESWETCPDGKVFTLKKYFLLYTSLRENLVLFLFLIFMYLRRLSYWFFNKKYSLLEKLDFPHSYSKIIYFLLNYNRLNGILNTGQEYSRIKLSVQLFSCLIKLFVYPARLSRRNFCE